MDLQVPSPLWEGLREGCGTCAFGSSTTWGPPGNQHTSVLCRRYPPQMVATTERNQYDGLNYDVAPFQPTMDEADWCGEYKRNQP